MPEIDPGPLPIDGAYLSIINGSPIYTKSPVLAKRLSDLSSTFVIIYITYYCYQVKSPALAIILVSLLYHFASKPGKICTRNSIDSFLITSS